MDALTNVFSNDRIKMEGAKYTVYPPGPAPKARNFGWFDGDDFEFFMLFGEGCRKVLTGLEEGW